jgi:hypothetical protein
MSNPKIDYNEYIRANLPSGLTYSNNRYRYNDKAFFNYTSANWYRDYLAKTEGFVSGGEPFSPASLFASGEEGAWYEPSTTSAFLSTTDLTPCAVGDACGFLLDKSQGAGYSGGSFTGLGSELVTNGTFDSDISGWSRSGAVSTWSGGEVTVIRTGPYQLHFGQNSVAVVAGKTYKIDYDITFMEGGSTVNFAYSSAVGGPPNLIQNHYSAGSFSVVWTAPSDDLAIGFGTNASVAGFTVDNISVRELPGNHATQTTAAARPILRASPNHLESDEVDDVLNWIAPAGTDYTIAYVNTAGTVTTLTEQSLDGATDILLDPALVGYVAVDRALTSEEATGLQTYLGALA